MRKITLFTLLVGLSVLLVACGGSATPAPVDSSTVINVTVETNPNPAATGDAELILTITDANGNPIEGATVDVSAEHTGMNMGEMNGVATEQGGGKYAIVTNFNMGGTWKVTVYVRKDGLDTKQEIEIPVQ